MISHSTKAPSRIAYGFWRYSRAETETAMRMMEAARAAGVDHFDTADVYGVGEFGGAETLLGEIRKRAPSLLSGVRLATKAGVESGTPYNASADYLERAAEASLRRLGVDAIDLFYVHRPDIFAHPAETAKALDRLVASGKAKAVGVSNYAVAQVTALSAFLKSPLVAHQLEFSAIQVDPIFNGALDQAMERGMGVFAWSPLAGGRLFDGADERSRRTRAALEAYAKERGIDISTAALSFVGSHPSRPVPIVGTKSVERLKFCAAAGAGTMERRDWYAILQASLGEKLP
ncbi:MAG: aldo/keto reductase [Pseudomonadota bacterium]|nr:aldo/keto reductase [Pseudomonadota bacterium]